MNILTVARFDLGSFKVEEIQDSAMIMEVYVPVGISIIAK